MFAVSMTSNPHLIRQVATSTTESLYDGNGRKVRSSNTYETWVYELNAKARNQLLRDLSLDVEDKQELMLQTKRHQLKLSQRRFRKKQKTQEKYINCKEPKQQGTASCPAGFRGLSDAKTCTPDNKLRLARNTKMKDTTMKVLIKGGEKRFRNQIHTKRTAAKKGNGKAKKGGECVGRVLRKGRKTVEQVLLAPPLNLQFTDELQKILRSESSNSTSSDDGGCSHESSGSGSGSELSLDGGRQYSPRNSNPDFNMVLDVSSTYSTSSHDYDKLAHDTFECASFPTAAFLPNGSWLEASPITPDGLGSDSSHASTRRQIRGDAIPHIQANTLSDHVHVHQKQRLGTCQMMQGDEVQDPLSVFAWGCDMTMHSQEY